MFIKIEKYGSDSIDCDHCGKPMKTGVVIAESLAADTPEIMSEASIIVHRKCIPTIIKQLKEFLESKDVSN